MEPAIHSGMLEKTDFLLEYPEYAETAVLDNLRATEYKRLDEEGHVYLDYTGGNLYSQSQLDAHFEFLKKNVLGNPHSTNPTSKLATDFVESTRKKVLEFFHAGNEYYCVFTQNATQALNIVGECFPFEENGAFLLSFDNHNSVNGIREYAKIKGANFEYVRLHAEDLTMDENDLLEKFEKQKAFNKKLFAFPAQSNVSGVKHPLAYVQLAQQNGYQVLLDAAAFVPTNILNLSEVKPEFVSISFYKMFGYPTGIGCLLIKKTAFEMLKKKGFSGGNVSLVSVVSDGFFLQNNHERFENGTVNYLGIPAVKIGLEWLEKISLPIIQKRVKVLTNYFITEAHKLTHSNGKKLINIAGPLIDKPRGGTVIFNVVDVEGNLFPIREVEIYANKSNISLRVGCFCNPGIDELNAGIQKESIKEFFTQFSHGNDCDVQDFLGIQRGNIRVSFGIVSNFEDVQKLLIFLSTFRDKITQKIMCIS